MPESPYRAALPVAPSMRRRWLRVVGVLAVTVSVIGLLSGTLMVRHAKARASALDAERAALEAERRRLDSELLRLEAEGGLLDGDAGRGLGDYPIWVPRVPRR